MNTQTAAADPREMSRTHRIARLLALAGGCLAAGAASGELPVHQDLGPLGLGGHAISGSTPAGVGGIAEAYADGQTAWSTYAGVEHVYRFELDGWRTLRLVNDQGAGVGTDHDYMLLDGLAHSRQSIMADIWETATDGVRFWNEEGVIVLPAGVYYLSVDEWTGAFVPRDPAGGAYAVTLSIEPPPPFPGTPEADEDLGVLAPGSVRLTGTTVGASSIFEGYRDAQGRFISEWMTGLGERIYAFEVATRAQAAIVNREGVGVGSDHEHFLLAGLGFHPFFGPVGESEVFVPVAEQALGYVAEEGSFEQLGENRYSPILEPGVTYYIAVDTFSGSAEGTYDLDLVLTEFVPPEAPGAIHLGQVGTAGEAITIHSLDSDFDTMLAVWDADGVLLAENDDAIGIRQSTVTLTLGEGEYYFSISGYSTTFGDGFLASVYEFSVNGNAAGEAGDASWSTPIASGENVFYAFTIGSEPGCIADFDGSGGVDVNDLLGFLGAFRQQDPAADISGDGAVTVDDLLGYLGAFRAGC